MRERIIAILAEILETPPERLTPEASPATVETWDSLRHMNVVLALEEEFGVRLTDGQIMRMITVGSVIETVMEAAGTQQKAAQR
jgi:acyl carrier protein